MIEPIDSLTARDIAARLSGSPEERAALVHSGAQAGIDEAQAVWGQMLLDRGEPRAAFGWFHKAAAQHHVLAINMVGRCYDLGWGVYNYATALALGAGVAEDKAAALGWLERAAALGNAKAINFVGSFCEDGWVVARDMARAAECYAKAAEGGDFRGAFNHARMLIEAGERDAALVWIERAGAWGNDRFRGQVEAWLAASALSAEGLAALKRGAAAR